MAKKKTEASEVRYLSELNPKIARHVPEIEVLVDDLSKRLSKLESKIQNNLDHLSKELDQQGKDSSKDPKKVREDLKHLQRSLEKQVKEISTTLRDSLEKAPFEKPSLLQKIKNIIPSLDFLSGKSQHKDFEQVLKEEFDPFGRDPEFEKKIKPLFNFLYKKYWRIETHGLENVPSKGRAMLVANHSGTVPYDGTMIRMAVSTDHPAERDVRFLVEDFVYYLPFIGSYMYRLGGVRADRDNAEQLLNSDHLVAVFPEGVKGIGKKFSKRYHLQRFGRGGFIKIALKTGSPIVPVAVIGAEEIHPILYKSSFLAKPLGIPYIPFTPTLPLLGLLGAIPLPSKWSIHFGRPIDLSEYGVGAIDDELLIHKLSEMVRQKIQKMVTDALKKRQSVWLG